MTNAELISQDPGWIIALKGVVIFAACVFLTIMSVWGERRIVARMQQRSGPNRVGKFGLLQALVDGVKLALKEDLIPKAADRIVFVLAPIISTTTCFMAFAVIPLTGEVNFFGYTTAMQLTDLSVGVLYVLAIASVGVYGIVFSRMVFRLHISFIRRTSIICSSYFLRSCYGAVLSCSIYIFRINVHF
jgi:NADH-quinone oxidoreductase subunit H